MKLLLTIFACLVAASAGAQTIKSLGYNTTNGNIVAATNVTFTNSVGFATNARAATRTNLGLGATWLTNTNVTNFRTEIGLGASSSVQFDAITTASIGVGIGATSSFTVDESTIEVALPIEFALGSAAGTRTNLGLGATNNVTFSNITATGTLGVSNAATFATNVSINTLTSIQTNSSGFADFRLTLPNNANVLRITVPYAINRIDNGRIGAFYYLINESGSPLVINSGNGITVQGGSASLTLGANQAATLVATGPTNVSVAGRGDLTDVALGGTLNTAPSQTNASSASSLMTRDLVGQEFANPRTKMQTTYWFGLEGLGGWQAVNGGANAIANRGPKFGPSLSFYAGAKPATSASGVGVRLGANSITGSGTWRPIDGGAFTAKTHVVNYYSDAAIGNRAFAFSFSGAANTNFWAAPDSFGLFWVQQPTNSWAASTAFTLNDRIAVSNVVWVVATAGTTDATAPTWTDLIGSTVTNGTAVFRNIGPHTSNNWVLAMGSTNASQVVMTNTGKTNWLRTTGSGHEVLLTLRYGTNTTAPYTVYGSVADGTGQGAEVTLNLLTNTTQVSPQYWLRFDGTNTAVGNEAAGIRYFSIDAETPPLN